MLNLTKKIVQNKKLLVFFLVFVIFIFTSPLTNAGVVPCGLRVDDANLAGDQTVPCTLCHLITGFYNIFDWFKTVLITIAAVGIFISGVMYIVSSGNEGAITKSKAFLQASITGFIVVLSAWFIVNVTMWVISADPESITNPNATGIERKAWNRFECATTSSASTSGTTPTSTSSSAAIPSTSGGSIQAFVSTLPISPIIPQGFPEI